MATVVVCASGSPGEVAALVAVAAALARDDHVVRTLLPAAALPSARRLALPPGVRLEPCPDGAGPRARAGRLAALCHDAHLLVASGRDPAATALAGLGAPPLLVVILEPGQVAHLDLPPCLEPPPRAARRALASSAHVAVPDLGRDADLRVVGLLPAPRLPEDDAEVLAARAWLRGRAPPLVLSTGGRADPRDGALLAAAADAASALGLPLVVVSADGAPGAGGEALACGEALLPTVLEGAAALVHPGGFGATGEALLAGVPALLLPELPAAAATARLVRRLGVGVALDRARLDGRGLAAALRRLLAGDAPRRAAELRERLATDDAAAALRALARELLAVPRGGPPIPRLLHQTWRDAEPPPELAALARTWREHHPTWSYKLWTDDEARDLVARCAPDLLAAYDGYPEPIMRVDAFRYVLMEAIGGVYVDLDFECLRPLGPLLAGRSIALGLEPPEHLDEPIVRERGLERVVGNAFLASAPGRPFWAHVRRELEAARAAPSPLDATGPFLLTRALSSYAGPDRPDLLPAALLQPVGKRAAWSGALRLSTARERLIEQGAYAVHHWHGTWCPDRAPPDLRLAPEPPLHLLVERRVVSTGTLARRVWRGLRAGQARPLVSALLVTKDRPAQAACAIAAFRAQRWPARELVVVDDGEDDALARHVAALDDPTVRMVRLPPGGLPLGALRNRAVAEARGELVCQWDDDDLHHPERIGAQVDALRALEADACMLLRWTLWWPRLCRLAFSRRRPWEGSLLARRDRLPPYPELRRGEDTPAVAALCRAGRVALLDEPRLYVYAAHGANTFDPAHFEAHWQHATDAREGPPADAWLRELEAQGLPVERTLAALGLPPLGP